MTAHPATTAASPATAKSRTPSPSPSPATAVPSQSVCTAGGGEQPVARGISTG